MKTKLIVDRSKDLIDRVGWTFIEAYIGLGAIDWISNGINLSLVHNLYAGLGAATAATIKVLIAQRLGKTNDGAAIPGGVVAAETVAVAPPEPS